MGLKGWFFGRDEEPAEDCAFCWGRGQVVQPITKIDLETGEATVVETAGACPDCRGSGKAR